MTRGITQMGVPKVEAKLQTPKSLQQLEIVRGEAEEQGGRGYSDALGDRISQLVYIWVIRPFLPALRALS